MIGHRGSSQVKCNRVIEFGIKMTSLRDFLKKVKMIFYCFMILKLLILVLKQIIGSQTETNCLMEVIFGRDWVIF
jgi:hypothetical protein